MNEDEELASLRFYPRELILLFLEPFQSVAQHETTPASQTQVGITKALQKGRTTISRELLHLMDENLIQCEIRHVEGENRRRQVYWLTTSGRDAFQTLKDSVMEREIEIQTLDGELKICKLKDVNTTLGLQLPLITILSMVSSAKPFQRENIRAEESRFLPELTSNFVGRENELQQLQEWLGWGLSSVLVISSMAGMGKTSLGRVVYEQQRGKRLLVWITVTQWDTPETLIGIMAKLLVSIGRTDLESKLAKFTSSNQMLPRAAFLEIIANHFQGAPSPLVIIDDLHVGQSQFIDFLMDLILWSKKDSGPLWLLMSRTQKPLEPLRGKMDFKSIALPGLTPVDLKKLFPDRDEEEHETLVKVTGGHPLAMKLLATINDQQHFEKLQQFIESQILSELTPMEKRALEIAALQPIPTSEEDMLVESKFRREEVMLLKDQGLLERNEEDKLSIHDLIRQPVIRQLKDSTKRDIHRALFRHFRAATDDNSILRSIFHLTALGDKRGAIKLVNKWGHELVNRGKSELFFLLEPLMNDERGPKEIGVILIKARIHFLWGEKEEALQLTESITKASTRGLAPHFSLQLLTLKIKIAREYNDLGQVKELQHQLVKLDGHEHSSWAIGEAHNELGLAAETAKDIDAARHHYEQAIQILEQCERQGEAPAGSPGSIKALANLALLQVDQGEIEVAFSNLMSAVQRAEQKRDRPSKARCLSYLANLMILNPDDIPVEIPGPWELLEEAKTIFDEMENRSGMCQVIMEMARYAVMKAELGQARSFIKQATELAKKIGSKSLFEEIDQIKNSMSAAEF